MVGNGRTLDIGDGAGMPRRKAVPSFLFICIPGAQ